MTTVIPPVVSGLGAGGDAVTRVNPADHERVSTLPDYASGLFAPGWDVSADFNADENSSEGIAHLANYGAGSPFLEDARLCAADNAFWPAIAPDQTRVYEPRGSYTVTPIPQSRLGWDGNPPPVIGSGVAQFRNLAYADYVQQALGAGFDFGRIGATTVEEYETWTLLMARVYQAIGASDTFSKSTWTVLYFDQASANDPDLIQAQSVTGIGLNKPYRFDLAVPLSAVPRPGMPAVVDTIFRRSLLAFATRRSVLYLDSLNAGWQARVF